LVDEIGGTLVKSVSATTNLQDPHYIRAKPSLMAKIRNADLLICTGADLEICWLPILLRNAKSSVQMGNEGNLMTSNLVRLIEKPEILDRSMGDIHAAGNPHFHLDPNNILPVAQEINLRLQKIDPENAAIYQSNYQNFSEKWQKSIKIWQQKAEKLKGAKIVVNHKSFSYLINWLEMDEIGSLEPKAGVTPSAAYLSGLLEKLKNNPPNFVILTPFDAKNASNWLVKQMEVKIVRLPYTVKKGGDLFKMFDETIDLMLLGMPAL
jgi:zinc/manganese transport system substrate-binding protein